METPKSDEEYGKVFSSLAKFASQGKAIKYVEVKVAESKTSGHRPMEMVLTLFDGAVITGSIPAIVESGDESFIMSYSNDVIALTLIGHDPTKQDVIDDILGQLLDEISNEHLSDKMKKLARNVNWAVSAAVCKAGAYANKIDPYKYVGDLFARHYPDYEDKIPSYEFPILDFGITNGAMHPAKTSAQQHLAILLTVNPSVSETIKRTKEIYDSYFKGGTAEGDEGCYTPNIQEIKKGLKSLMRFFADFGCTKFDVSIGVDVGASQFYEFDGTYRMNIDGSHKISAEALIDVYQSLVSDYNVLFIEDPFHCNDWKYSDELIKKRSNAFLAPNEEWKVIYELRQAACSPIFNAFILKVSQIGSVSECMKLATMVKLFHMRFIMDSHHSCESSDPFIADLCVGLMMEQIKIGVSCITSACKICNRLHRIGMGMGGNLPVGVLCDIASTVYDFMSGVSRKDYRTLQNKDMYDEVKSGKITRDRFIETFVQSHTLEEPEEDLDS